MASSNPTSDAATTTTTKTTPVHVWAFDFDGVLCDSVRETGKSAWRTARKLFGDKSESKSESSELDNAPSFATAITPTTTATTTTTTATTTTTTTTATTTTTTTCAAPSSELLDQFSLVRPCLHTGWEAVLMVHGLHRGDYTVEEILTRFSTGLREEALARYGVSADTVREAFGRTRQEWIAGDTESWLGANGFYQEPVRAVQRLAAHVQQQHGDDESVVLYVITTKDADLAARLLARCDIPVPRERIFGLGSGPKADVLTRLCAEHTRNCVPPRIFFLEDKFSTLEGVSKRADLVGGGVGGTDSSPGDGGGRGDTDRGCPSNDGCPSNNVLPIVQLALAEWGYVTDEHVQEARKKSGWLSLTQAGLAKHIDEFLVNRNA